MRSGKNQTHKSEGRASAEQLRSGAVLDGVELGEFAGLHGLTVPQVWQRVRVGELAGRMVDGRFLVFIETPPTDFTAAPKKKRAPAKPAPTRATDDDAQQARNAALSEQMSHEVTAILEHFHLARMESRELVKFTEESLRRMAGVAETVAAMKDAVISQNEEQIRFLRAMLSEKDSSLRSLRQKVEDLETLAGVVDRLIPGSNREM